MIFKDSFDELMQNIWSEQLMDIGTGEVVCEWLQDTM
jgi:hypothetical protein